MVSTARLHLIVARLHKLVTEGRVPLVPPNVQVRSERVVLSSHCSVASIVVIIAAAAATLWLQLCLCLCLCS